MMLAMLGIDEDYWNKHGLTIALFWIGLGPVLLCIPLEAGEMWDFMMTIGGGTWVVALVFRLQAHLNEVNRPNV